MTTPLDPVTWLAVTQALDRARWSGMNIPEALNKAGFILSPAARLEIERSILGRLLDELRLWQPHEMLRRAHLSQDGGTPADMYRAVQGYLEEFIEHRKEQS